ncbi:eIF-2-alpha kinase activator GCN1-like [Acropora millepora]|uniref:eIF-2-alpha kinase activator GCN1-like n=1 Tax=Acropora millepora TaxID=45264 RepID=UPI001CF4F502|nr:eIF-2-alpha kinase activator GCN1-like [Acropora millepora]
MAAQIIDILKNCAVKITSSSTKEREFVCRELVSCIQRNDFSEFGVKAVIKLIFQTQGLYRDNRSRKAIEEVVKVLAEKQGSDAVKYFCLSFSDIEKQATFLHQSYVISGSNLVVLCWSCILVKQVYNGADLCTGAQWSRLVTVQCLALYGVLSAGKSCVCASARKKLHRVWNEVPGITSKYAEAISNTGPAQEVGCLVGFLFNFCTKSKDTETINKFKNPLLDMYLKVVISSKTRPPSHLLVHIGPLLSYVTHNDFGNLILPAVTKALLRNPEIVLESTAYLISSVSIDLSKYALDICKTIIGQLRAKEERHREEAALVLKNLAHQCSDPEALENLINFVFGVLNGSEGKLTQWNDRVSVLQGLRSLEKHSVSGSSSVQGLSHLVTEKLVKYLQHEVHEGALVCGLSVLSQWCRHFSNQVPKVLVDAFKKGMMNKNSTSVVRTAYLQCVAKAFQGNTLLQGMDILPQLLQTVEKVKVQPNQPAVVTEGLLAASIILRLSLADVQAESKLDLFWVTFLDAKKQLFVSEKYMSTASEEALLCLVSVIEKLFLSHGQRLNKSNSQPWQKALVFLLTHTSWKIRHSTQSCIQNLYKVSGESALELQSSLLAEFSKLLEVQKHLIPDNVSVVNGDAPLGGSSGVSTRALPSALLCLVFSLFETNQDLTSNSKDKVALQVLPDAHHPVIFSNKDKLWLRIVRHIGVEIDSFLNQNVDAIMEVIVSAKRLPETSRNVLQSVTEIAPSVFFPRIVKHCTIVLAKPEFSTVTVEEFAIMNTPEGELHDKSVQKRAKLTEAAKRQNMKKESKAYSYEDQIWEMEVRESLKKKKKSEGKLSEKDEMGEKEKNAIEAQLAKEAEIRNRLQELHQQISEVGSLLDTAITANHKAACQHIPTLSLTLVPLLQYPLTAPVVMPLFLKLGETALDKEYKSLSDIVAYVTLRLLKPMCSISSAWCEENLLTSTKRVLSILHTLTVPPGGPRTSHSTTEFLSAPAFAFCFSFLRLVLRDSGKAVGRDEDLRYQALQVVAEHCSLRAGDNQEEDDKENKETDPALLPRQEMFSLLTEIMSTSPDTINGTRLHQLASQSLVELCEASSGDEGCATVSPVEISILLKALESPVSSLRFATLKGLLVLGDILLVEFGETAQIAQLMKRLWVAKFDVDEENAKLSEKIWEELGFSLPQPLCSALLEDVVHDVEVVRNIAPLALAAAITEHPDVAPFILQQLLDLYEEKLKIPPPVVDSLGRVVPNDAMDASDARCGIAQALGELAPKLSEEEVLSLFVFFVPTGLGDRSVEVRKHMLNAALKAINHHGKANISVLLPVFEQFLDLAPDTSEHDTIRQAVVILMGCLARHLDKDDPKVRPIVGKLLSSLSTPSQQVQEAVANCLPPLVPAIKSEAPEMVKNLLKQLLKSSAYGERKGAAYGLAGLVKGLGILHLKQLNIMSTLQEAIQDKKNQQHREGALFAYEMLCSMLGRLFEPYVVHVLPNLLLCFGDGSSYVRQATDDTARAVMKNLSAHGVKLVLPSLLEALKEDSWRTKTGSVELLGAMAFCAPKQLSSCLPSIVPCLCEVLTDSHTRVQKASAQALKQIGSVIRNPEILAISSFLLQALMDPSTKTAPCLQVLLQTSFVHFIDAPSLALIMPVLQRALGERSTETKKMAAQIIGNMYSLTDKKDLAPYLPSVIPGLKQALLDPVPEVRAVASRALGAMVRGIGEDSFEDLLPWLMETLTSENSSVDRSGAAQGLGEVLCALGTSKLESLMPEVISTTERPDLAPHIREGYLMLYIYLPSTFKDDFIPWVGPVIPSVLKGLADEAEYVRDTSLKAGQRIINLYADTAIELFLPELETGLFDDNWRIRHSSVQLLGDLLYRVSGVTGKMSTEGREDENFGTSHSNQAIIKSLGADRRNRVLAGLYMGRSDVSLMVRQSALHVWKVVVPNTPRILREILPTLFSLLLGCLASTSYDKRQVAARTLGDLVRKLGERILPEIIPILERGLDSDKNDERQGVCIGLSEIVASTSREQVVQYVDSLVPTVRRALIDPLPEVRVAAARTFGELHKTIGVRALDEILPSLLARMDDPTVSEYALDGLKQVMEVKSKVVLPFLVPQLITPPVNMRALAILSAVTGDSLTSHLGKILPAMLNAIQDCFGTEHEKEELEGASSLVLSVEDDVGIRTIVDELMSTSKHPEAGMRRASISLLYTFCEKTDADYSQFIPTLFRGIIYLMNDSDELVVDMSWNALNAVTKRLEPSEQLQYISHLRQAVKFVADDIKGGELPGFCLPKKGIAPILPIFREGILNGSPEFKEQSAKGLGEVINLTSAAALRPFVVNITGPLIRILGDRFTWNVKVAVLETLGLLLGKVGAMLKPFLPQLQTTFIKALNDPTRAVRMCAANALQKLIKLHTRVDPLFTELHNGVKNTDDNTIRETLLQALRGVIAGAGEKMGEPIRKALTTTLLGLLGHPDDAIRVTAGGCIGALAMIVPDPELHTIITDHLIVNDPIVDWTVRHGHAIALSAVLHDAAERIVSQGLLQAVTDAAVLHAGTDRIPICSSGLRSLGFILAHSVIQCDSPQTQVSQMLLKVLQEGSNDVKMLAAACIQHVARATSAPLHNSLLKALIPTLIVSCKEKNTGVKAAAESALMYVLRLREGESMLQSCCRMFDASTAESIQDLCRRSLRRLATQEEDTDELEATFSCVDQG